jgi:hypothetical protein
MKMFGTQAKRLLHEAGKAVPEPLVPGALLA